MKKKLKLIIPLIVLAALIAAFLLYTQIYYHADESAAAALQSNEKVSVRQTEQGWFFDGSSEENVLVFYPGGRVEETAYAPLMHMLAEQGIDVCLVKMPFRLAVFAENKVDELPELSGYAQRYIGGHSLGGAVAALYAAENGDSLNGLILLAAYPSKELEDDFLLLSIYGSEDGILNMDKIEDGRQFAPNIYEEFVIEGGNHAQFGCYGAQKGDGAALITAEEQQRQTVELIMRELALYEDRG